MKTLLSLLATLPLLAQTPLASISALPGNQEGAPVVPAAGDESLSGSVDLGYRWFSGAGGNFQSYRSLVDLGSGPKVFGWDLSLQGSARTFYDRIDTQGFGWGGDPSTTARIHARKAALYDFTGDYRNMAYFNDLPSYADPLINTQQGYFLNENVFDLHRRMLDIQLTLRPGKRIIPYLEYDRNWQQSRDVTTYVANSSSSYPINGQSGDKTQSFRGGVQVELKQWHITLEQNGFFYDETDSAANSGTSLGNSPSTFNGQPLFLGALNQNWNISSSGIYSKALTTAHPFSWMDLHAEFLYSEPKTTANYVDSATGLFLRLPPPALFPYTGNAFTASTAINQPHTSGAAGIELRPLKHLRIVESWSTDRLHGAANGPTIQELISVKTFSATIPAYSFLIKNSSQQEVDVMYNVSSWLMLRGGDRYIWGDGLVLTPLASTSLFESAKSNQQIGLAGATIHFHQKLTAAIDFERGSSNNSYFRTSLYDYRLARIRARYQATNSLFFNVNLSLLDNHNPTAGVGFTYQSRDNSLSVVWSPGGGKRFSFTGEYSRATFYSDQSYLNRTDLSSIVDRYRENDHTGTAVVDLALPALEGMTPKLSVGGALFTSSGSRPERLYEPLARLSLPIHKGLSWNTEWRWYGFGEQFYLYEGFRAHVLTTGIRLTR